MCSCKRVRWQVFSAGGWAIHLVLCLVEDLAGSPQTGEDVLNCVSEAHCGLIQMWGALYTIAACTACTIHGQVRSSTHACMQTRHSHMHACRHTTHTCMHADIPITHACRHATHTSALVRKSMSSIFSLRARLNKPGQSTSNSQYTGNRPASSMLDSHAVWRVGHWLHLDNCPNAISCSLAPPPPRLLPARQGAPVSPALPGLQ